MILPGSETIRMYENEMLDKVYIKMKKGCTPDQIMRYYRRAKIWLTNHRFIAKACTQFRYEELNKRLNDMKAETLLELDMKQYKED